MEVVVVDNENPHWLPFTSNFSVRRDGDYFEQCNGIGDEFRASAPSPLRTYFRRWRRSLAALHYEPCPQKKKSNRSNRPGMGIFTHRPMGRLGGLLY